MRASTVISRSLSVPGIGPRCSPRASVFCAHPGAVFLFTVSAARTVTRPRAEWGLANGETIPKPDSHSRSAQGVQFPPDTTLMPPIHEAVT
jgi:hypothetical protein